MPLAESMPNQLNLHNLHNQRISRMLLILRIVIVFALGLVAAEQAYRYFLEWQDLPHKNLSAWRLEYADIDFEVSPQSVSASPSVLVQSLQPAQSVQSMQSGMNQRSIGIDKKSGLPKTASGVSQAEVSTPQGVHQFRFQLQVDPPIHALATSWALPHLEVLLTNVNGTPVAHRILSPQEWLGSQTENAPPIFQRDYLGQGAASPTQFTVSIPIELPEDASGFQVQMLYSLNH